MSATQSEQTCPVRMSRDLHRRVKERAARYGLKLQAVADVMAEVWLALPEKKAFPKKWSEFDR
jgi:predicted DNA binding CopG/RHH family protein